MEHYGSTAPWDTQPGNLDPSTSCAKISSSRFRAVIILGCFVAFLIVQGAYNNSSEMAPRQTGLEKHTLVLPARSGAALGHQNPAVDQRVPRDWGDDSISSVEPDFDDDDEEWQGRDIPAVPPVEKTEIPDVPPVEATIPLPECPHEADEDHPCQQAKDEMARLDTNNNNLVDLEEVKAYIRKEFYDPAEYRQEGMTDEEAERNIIRDTNEFREQIDINKDGQLDFDELVVHYKNGRRRLRR